MAKNCSEVMSTELVWPGKETEVERVVLPFQTVETVNKPRVDQPRMDFGEWAENYPRDWKSLDKMRIWMFYEAADWQKVPIAGLCKGMLG